MIPTALDEFTGEYRHAGTQLLYQHCPVCGSQRWKTYVDPETGKWFCFAGEHGGGGRVDIPSSFDKRASDLLSTLHAAPEPGQEWPEINLPPWEPLTPRALRYLQRRGVSEDDARRLAMVEAATDENLGYLIVPHFNRRNEIVYWASRAYASYAEGPKYKGASGRKPLYVPEHGLGGGPHEQIVVCEGPFDAVSIWQAGYVAVALGGKALPKYLMPDLLAEVRPDGEIIIMLDREALRDALLVQRQLEGWAKHVRIVLPPGRGTDPGDLSPDEVRAAIG